MIILTRTYIHIYTHTQTHVIKRNEDIESSQNAQIQT